VDALKVYPWLQASVSHTTRSPRSGEENGKDYHFVDRSTFDRMVQDNEFLEWAEVHGHRYGSSIRNLDVKDGKKALLFEVDCRGAWQIREKVAGAVLVFVMTPSFKDLMNRITKRGRISKQEFSTRIRTAQEEIRQSMNFDFLVINDDFSEARKRFQSILAGQQGKREAITPAWMEQWSREFRHLSDDLNR